MLSDKDKFLKYEKVRLIGHYNMFDSRAIMESGLSKSDYIWVMNNYSKLYNTYHNDAKNLEAKILHEIFPG